LETARRRPCSPDICMYGAAVSEYASCCNAIRLTHAISQVQHKKIKENGQPYRTYLLSSNHSASEVSIDVDRWQQHVYTRGHGTPQRRCNRPTQPATVCNRENCCNRPTQPATVCNIENCYYRTRNNGLRYYRIFSSTSLKRHLKCWHFVLHDIWSF